MSGLGAMRARGATVIALPVARQREGVRPTLSRAAAHAWWRLLSCAERAASRRVLGELPDRMLRDVGLDACARDREMQKWWWQT